MSETPNFEQQVAAYMGETNRALSGLRETVESQQAAINDLAVIVARLARRLDALEATS